MTSWFCDCNSTQIIKDYNDSNNDIFHSLNVIFFALILGIFIIYKDSMVLYGKLSNQCNNIYLKLHNYIEADECDCDNNNNNRVFVKETNKYDEGFFEGKSVIKEVINEVICFDGITRTYIYKTYSDGSPRVDYLHDGPPTTKELNSNIPKINEETQVDNRVIVKEDIIYNGVCTCIQKTYNDDTTCDFFLNDGPPQCSGVNPEKGTTELINQNEVVIYQNTPGTPNKNGFIKQILQYNDNDNYTVCKSLYNDGLISINYFHNGRPTADELTYRIEPMNINGPDNTSPGNGSGSGGTQVLDPMIKKRNIRYNGDHTVEEITYNDDSIRSRFLHNGPPTDEEFPHIGGVELINDEPEENYSLVEQLEPQELTKEISTYKKMCKFW